MGWDEFGTIANVTIAVVAVVAAVRRVFISEAQRKLDPRRRDSEYQEHKSSMSEQKREADKSDVDRWAHRPAAVST